MKTKIMNFGTLFPMVAAGMLVYAGAAFAQTEKRVIEAPKEAPIEIGRATANSPGVNLKDVGNEVAPGVFVVDPSSTRGKRLVLPRGGAAARHVCHGKWTGPTKTCEGVFIEW
jgi:hypothetical protein